MRIDKYLKNARIIKRRTIAQQACEQGKIKINDKVVKSSANIKIGDIIEIVFGNNVQKIEVIDINENAKKEDATKLYKNLIVKEDL